MSGMVPRVPIVAVASGKGGVGKTTTAVNLAIALGAGGLTVGLVDADLYGPDVPRMMGLRRGADTSAITLFMRSGNRNSKLEPVRRYGVQLSSAAFLMGENQALSVQAPIAQLLVHRLLADTQWDGLDCLIVDLPPGTADIQQFVLGLSDRQVHVLVVVTPQVVAHQDVRRLIADRARLRGSILGGIENMSGLVCPSCGDVVSLYPPAPEPAAVWGLIPKLAAVPFSPEAARDADEGNPVMVTRRVPQQVVAYERVAEIVRERFGD